MRFVWDPFKAKSNLSKHGVSFDEAVTAFIDESALRINDPDHSHFEDRWILVGLSLHIRVVVVVHVEKEDDVVRIVSARKANKKEIADYMRRRI